MGTSQTVALPPSDFATHPFIRSIKEEYRERVIPLGEAHLRELLREPVAHSNGGRPHQGLDGNLIEAANDSSATHTL